MSFDKNILETFHKDSVTRDEIRRYIIAIMEEMAVKRVFDGGDVNGFKVAKAIIEEAWSRLDKEFGGYEPERKITPEHR